MPDAPPALVLFDDAAARNWRPFTLTRPAGELLFGTLTLRERAERVTGLPCIGHITAAHLAGFDEHGAPPVLDPASPPRERDLLFLSSRAVLDIRSPSEPSPKWERDELVAVAGTICGRYLPAGAEPPGPDFLTHPDGHAPDGLPVRELSGELLGRVWELIGRNAERTAADIASLHPDANAEPPAGTHATGSGRLVVADSATVEPDAVFDLRDGPVRLDEDVYVRAGTRLAGPAYVGRASTLFGGPYEAVSVGPVCKLRGELEETVVLGYANKAHAGYIGHAYLGRWTNLGAMTTNSDLKNTYGTIRLWTPEGVVDTGETKLGCLLGDHVRTAIGTLLNTGTVVGAGANIFGSGMPPKRVAPFRWGTDEPPREYDLQKFLRVTEKVMERRDRTLSESQRDLLRAAWQRGRSEAR